jgi:hypothetical protein
VSQDNVIKLARPGEFCDALTGVFRQAAESRNVVNAHRVNGGVKAGQWGGVKPGQFAAGTKGAMRGVRPGEDGRSFAAGADVAFGLRRHRSRDGLMPDASSVFTPGPHKSKCSASAEAGSHHAIQREWLSQPPADS